MSVSASKTVFGPMEIGLIGRLYLECCERASAERHGAIEDATKMRIARSLIRSFDRYEYDPEMMKQLALRVSRLVA
jgi:hypothetical protein